MDDPLYSIYRDHLKARHPDDLHRIDDWLHRMAIGHSGFEVYDRPKDTKALDRLDRVIAEIAALFAEGSMSESSTELMLDAMSAIRSPKDVTWSDDTKYGPLPEMSAMDALNFLDEYRREIRRAIASLRARIEESEKSRRTLSNLNLEGVRIVGVARDIWESETGRKAPRRDLNPGSPFFAFLQALLEALGVEGDARSVFRAWRREDDRRSQSRAN